MDAAQEMLRQVQILVNHHPLNWGREVYLQERDRLEFEIDTGDLPLDIYSVTLELERDELSQGIAVDWNVRRPNNKISTREWQQKMQEEQYAGDCSVTLLYRGMPVPGCTANIQFQVTRLQQQHYEFMRQILKEQNEQVLFSKKGRTHELALLYGDDSPAGMRFQVVRDHHKRLMGVLPHILEDPHRELRRIVTVTSANTIKALNYSSLQLAARSGGQWMALGEDNRVESVLEQPAPAPLNSRRKGTQPLTPSSGPMADWQRKLESMKKKKEKVLYENQQRIQKQRIIPRRVPVVSLEESFDTYENRFLKKTLQKFIELTILVEERLIEEIRVAEQEQQRSSRLRIQALQSLINKNKGYILELHWMRKNLNELINTTFLAELGRPGPNRVSVVLRENRHYRRIRQLEGVLADSIEIVSSTVGLDKAGQSVRLSSVNQLYEYWVTVVTLQTMVDKLGFTVIAKEGRAVNQGSSLSRASNPFNYILQSGGSMELISPLGKRVVVYYDREYLSPYEHTAGAGPLYYGYYAPQGLLGSTKRKPDIAIEVFSEDEKVPKIVVLDATYSRDPRTLYAKYQYRDTIRDYNHTDVLSGKPARIVTAAWVVYPDAPERLEHDEFRYGQLPLQPGPTATDQMARILRQLLQIAGALEQ